MKNVMAANVLKRLLSNMERLGASGDATHPGFKLLHFEVTKQGGVRATAQNAVASLRMAVPPMTDNGPMVPGAIALPLSEARAIKDAMPDTEDHVGLSLTEEPGKAPRLRVACGPVLLKMPTMELTDLIPFQPPPKEGWFDVEVETLSEILNRIAWACASTTDARVNLQGIHVTPKFIEAADGHKLVRMESAIFTEDRVIPPAAIALPVAITGGKNKVKIAFDATRIWCQGNGFIMHARIVDMPFPNTDGLYIDDGAPFAMANDKSMKAVQRAVIPREALREAASTALSVFLSAGKDDVPTLRFTPGKDPATLNVISKKMTGVGIDMSRRVPWTFSGDQAALDSLQAVVVNAAYTQRAVAAMPDVEDLTLSWLGHKERLQISAGGLRAVIMTREY